MRRRRSLAAFCFDATASLDSAEEGFVSHQKSKVARSKVDSSSHTNEPTRQDNQRRTQARAKRLIHARYRSDVERIEQIHLGPQANRANRKCPGHTDVELIDPVE